MTSTTNPTTATGAVTWFEIHAADPARAEAFYGQVFGWRFDRALPGYTMVEPGGEGALAGGIRGIAPGEAPDAVLCVQVPDVAATRAAVLAAGGMADGDVQSTPDGLTFCYVRDTEGARFSLWCPPRR